jgi:hypothetical protein
MAEITRLKSAVNFLKGTQAQYNALTSAQRNENTFYYLSDVNELYLGTIKLSNLADAEDAMTKAGINEQEITKIKATLSTLTGDGTSDSIQGMIDTATSDINSKIGDLANLTTDAKNNLVAAINEAEADAKKALSGSVVSVTKASVAQDGYSATYYVTQNGVDVGVPINIPKDLVVSAGEVVKNPSGQTAGTYIVLTIANKENSKLYINVEDLVDIYTGGDSTYITTSVNSNNQLLATLKSGSIDETALADSAVTTNKIKKANVTKDKLESSVQTSLDYADVAIKGITTGTNSSGASTITYTNVKGGETTVELAGLGDLAYVNKKTIDDQISSTEKTLKGLIDANTNAIDTNATDITALDGKVDSQKTTLEAAISAAETDANSYTDTAISNAAGNYATAAQGKKADSAVQPGNITSGSTEGTIKVNSTEVAVTGLQDAAYTTVKELTATATDLANAAKTEAIASANQYTEDALNTCLVWGSIA